MGVAPTSRAGATHFFGLWSLVPFASLMHPFFGGQRILLRPHIRTPPKKKKIDSPILISRVLVFGRWSHRTNGKLFDASKPFRPMVTFPWAQPSIWLRTLDKIRKIRPGNVKSIPFKTKGKSNKLFIPANGSNFEPSAEPRGAPPGAGRLRYGPTSGGWVVPDF